MYPLWMLWEEADIARKRVNRKIATEANLLHTAVSAVLSGDIKNLNKVLKRLNDGDD